MANSEEYRVWALIFGTVSSVLLFAGLFGGWCQFNDYTTPDNVPGFRGESTFGLWQFCADGTRTGIPFTPPSGGGNTTNSGTAQVKACAFYGHTYYTTIPICGTCLGAPCCYSKRIKMFKLPDPDATLHCARAFSVMAALFAAFVGCGSHYNNNEDRYEEKHGKSLGGVAVGATVCAIIATFTFVAFTNVDGFFFYTQKLQDYENFAYDWGFIVSICGWVGLSLGLFLQWKGLQTEELDAKNAEAEQLALTGGI